jgi:nucleotide-binding universal stress UspA family protein
MYTRILVAIEHSGADRAVLTHIEQLAGLTRARLLLVHVADGWAARHFEDLKLRESRRSRRSAPRTLWRAGERGYDVQGRLARRSGDRADQVAQEEQVDLIAMSTHGHRF